VAERVVDLVLFDLGGVLIDVGGVGPLRELAGIASDEELWTRWLASPWVQSFESGACTPEEFAAGFAAAWDLALSGPEFLAHFAGWPQDPYPGAAALVEQVQAQVPVACLSNMNRSQWEAHHEYLPLVERFDYRFLSYELGLVKPDPRIFAAVATRLPVEPGRVLFLDDNAVNVEAAAAAGYVARHVRGVDEARQALMAAGVLTGVVPG
jgi:HAD superfamily hydrolase (TIGR01509 family)